MYTILKVGFVGAGFANFGPGRPWCHASKIERLINDVTVIGIVDIDVPKAEAALRTRRASSEFGHIYADCKVFSDYKQLITLRPDVVIIGCPPGVRGSLKDGRDMELQFVKAGVHILVEKPLSTAPMEEFRPYMQKVLSEAKKRNVIISTGYVFRYHPAILKMKELIKQHGGKMMAFNSRFFTGCDDGARAKQRFKKELFGGTVIEEMTHFCDIARFISGSEIDLSTIQCVAVNDSDENGAGRMSNIADYEDGIPVDKRISRVTVAQWRFIDAGVGSVMVSIALPGSRMENSFDVHLDGLSFSFHRPYGELRVRNRSDGNPDSGTVYKYDVYTESDMYGKLLKTFFGAVRSKDSSSIRSSYSDAAKSYELSYMIRLAGERNKPSSLKSKY